MNRAEVIPSMWLVQSCKQGGSSLQGEVGMGSGGLSFP